MNIYDLGQPLYSSKLTRVLAKLAGNPVGRRAVAAAAYARAVWHEAILVGNNRHDRRQRAILRSLHRRKYRKLIANVLRGFGDFVLRAGE